MARAEVAEGWVALDEIVVGPLEGGIFSRNESWIPKSSGVCLKNMSEALLYNYTGT